MERINEFLNFITSLVFSTRAFLIPRTHTLGGQADIHIYICLSHSSTHRYTNTYHWSETTVEFSL